MSPVTHLLFGWTVANVDRSLNRRERAAITVAGIIPDIDGLGAVAEFLTRNSAHKLTWFSDYHHMMHNAAFSLLVAAVSFAVATRRWKTALLALFAFHLHLLCDVVGARGPDGYDWPIPYLLPFSRSGAWSWSGQWGLNSWQNFVITGVLLALTLYWAWQRGRSPLEIISTRADKAFVDVLRQRFGGPEKKAAAAAAQ